MAMPVFPKNNFRFEYVDEFQFEKIYSWISSSLIAFLYPFWTLLWNWIPFLFKYWVIVALYELKRDIELDRTKFLKLNFQSASNNSVLILIGVYAGTSWEYQEKTFFNSFNEERLMSELKRSFLNTLNWFPHKHNTIFKVLKYSMNSYYEHSGPFDLEYYSNILDGQGTKPGIVAKTISSSSKYCLLRGEVFMFNWDDGWLW